MEVGHDTYVPLVLLAIFAFLVPLAVGRIRLFAFPAVVAEILVGAALGRSGLGLIEPNDAIDFLAEFGFVYLMFVSGLELDLGLLRGRMTPRAGLRGLLRNPLVLGGAVFTGTFTLALLVGYFLVGAGYVRSTVITALILSTTSVGVVVPTLKERGEVGTSLGQVLLVSAVIADFVTMLLLTVTLVVHREGWSLEAMVVIVILAASLLVYFGLERANRLLAIRRILQEGAHAATQIKVRGALALMLIFLALSALLGTELILGAFLAGTLLGAFASHERGLLRQKLDAIGYGFFIPIFFMMVGARFDAAALGEAGALWLAGGMVIAAFVVKVVPSLLLAPRFGLRNALGAGFLLSARLSLIVVAADICRREGIIGDSVESAILIVAVVACLVSPIVYGQIRPQSAARHRKFVVAGLGRMGRELVVQLVAHRHPVSVIDDDPARLERLRVTPRLAVMGDATNADDLERTGLSAGDVLVACTPSDERNRKICRLARRRFGIDRLVALNNDPRRTDELKADGVLPVNLLTTTVAALLNLATRPVAFHMLTDAAEERDLFEVEVCTKPLRGVPLSKLPIPGSCRVLCIRREDDLIVARGSTRLQRGDVVTFYGTDEEREQVEEIFGGAVCDDT